jgi:hypothetical protein
MTAPEPRCAICGEGIYLVNTATVPDLAGEPNYWSHRRPPKKLHRAIPPKEEREG